MLSMAVVNGRLDKSTHGKVGAGRRYIHGWPCAGQQRLSALHPASSHPQIPSSAVKKSHGLPATQPPPLHCRPSQPPLPSIPMRACASGCARWGGSSRSLLATACKTCALLRPFHARRPANICSAGTTGGWRLAGTRYLVGAAGSGWQAQAPSLAGLAVPCQHIPANTLYTSRIYMHHITTVSPWSQQDSWDGQVSIDPAARKSNQFKCS